MSHKIKFQQPSEVVEFVNAANRCDFDIDVCYNRIIVDAKSILGILSMGIAHALTVTCHGENPEFNKTLQKFAAC